MSQYRLMSRKELIGEHVRGPLGISGGLEASVVPTPVDGLPDRRSDLGLATVDSDFFTRTSGSDVHSSGSGVKVTSTLPTVIVT